MSDKTDGKGLSAAEFDDEEIDWDDEPVDETSGLSPIEAMVGESMDVVVPEKDKLPDDED